MALVFSYRPALAVVAAQVVVGLEHVGYAHVGAVVVNLFSGAEGDYAEEHDLGEAGGVLERRRGFHLPLGGVYPVHFVGLASDARDRKSTRLNSSHRCISYA